MKKYLKPKVITWALQILGRLPKDQACLCYFLIFSKVNEIRRGSFLGPSNFEIEFYRYFGAPLKGGGVGCFNPFDGRWMAEDYINSTVYGRLVNGSHWWTDQQNGFFVREPLSGFPAKFKLHESSFERLQDRTTYPCMKMQALLPLTAIAVLYYRDIQVECSNPNSLEDLVKRFHAHVISESPKLSKLFYDGPSGPVDPFQDDKPTDDEYVSAYPTCPYKGESQINIRLYIDDVNAVKRANGISNGDFSDYFRSLIREKGIY